VGCDTTSHKANLELIQFVANFLDGHGIATHLIEDPGGTKANLWATVGPSDLPGVVLSGHTDVVPVDGQDWASDPFTVTASDNRLYGRGTADMKSFIASALAHVPQLIDANISAPVHFAFSYDEEIGCVGVHSLLSELKDKPVRPAVCFVGEPTGMRVVTAHKGKLAKRCIVTGKEAHSSLTHRAANAVEAASRIVVYLSDLARQLREEGPFEEEMDPPFATIHVGPIAGGEALNIVPNHCHFEYEMRFLPGQDAEAVLRQVEEFAETEIASNLRKTAKEAGVEWQDISLIVALNEPENSDAVMLAKTLTGANATEKVAFGTEAGLYSQLQIPTVVCGPGHIDQAHKPNEFISLEQVELCDRFMSRLSDRLASGPIAGPAI
jgi:acetylornithine deacetylase